MKASCPSCQTTYNIDDKRIPPGGAKLKCAKCQTTFPIRPGAAAVPLPGGADSAAIPLPGAGAPAGAIPLPGLTAARPQSQTWEEESTRVASIDQINAAAAAAGAIPLPGGEPDAGAVPLPGAGDFGTARDFDFSGGDGGAVPLPGATDDSAPTQFGTARDFDFGDGGGGAVPLPGGDDGGGAIPLPGGDSSSEGSAIPLPGGDSYSSDGSAIPLPGGDSYSSEGSAIPLPGLSAAPPQQQHWEEESTRVAPLDPGGAIPLPGSDSYPEGAAVPLPGLSAAPAQQQSWDEESTRVAPMDAIAPPPPPSDGGFDLDFGGGSSEPAPAASSAPAQDLVDFSMPPPAAPAPMDFGGDDFGAPPPPEAIAPPPPPSFELPDFESAAPPPPPPADPGGFDLDFAAPPPPSDGGLEMDFGSPPAPAAIAPPPPPDMDFDFADPPPPAEAAPAPVDFGELPPPPGGANDPGSIDFSDLPSPAAPPPPPQRAAAPPPASAPIDFGEVDFGSSEPPPPPPPPRAAPAAPPPMSFASDLEFDPTSSPSSGGGDDLEADLSAPLPPAPSTSQGPADGLEMLSFIDDAAKDQGAKGGKIAKTRYHVRRRSGKVFGPFEEGVVLKMLEDGQLLGNEDVSTDNESWSPIGTVSVFTGAIQRIMEAPGKLPTAEEAAPVEDKAAQTQATMDRLKNLYEGRMASISVVDKREQSEKFRKRLPLYIGAGAVALIVLIGSSLGITRYGMFAHKKLFPTTLSPGSGEHTEIEAAKQALLADTYQSYRDARDHAGKVLGVKEFPEARAVWCQAVFYLQRRYASSTPEETATATAALVDIELLGLKNAQVVKALAGHALAEKQPDEALQLLSEAKSRAENDADIELDLLAAEAHVQKNDLKQAEEALRAVLAKQPKSAKALHALGNLEQLQNKADAAAKAYSDAVEADPNHVVSAVELAAVELLVRKNVEVGAQAVERALTEENRKLLGPAEIARARALKGVALAGQFKPKEAVEELQKARQLDPGSLFVKANLARVLLGQREFEKALPLYKEASSLEPGNIDYTDGYLSALIATGKMVDAQNVVGGANQRFPGNARIAYLYGRVSDALDNAQDAEKHYKRAIAGDPQLVEAQLYLARFYLRFRRIADARPYIDQALAAAPENALVHAGAGELALAEMDSERAEAAFRRAVELEPNLADAHLGLSEVAFNTGKYTEARRHVDRALELDAKIADGRLQRGLVLWRLGDLDMAVSELEQAAVDDPKNMRVKITIGAVKLAKACPGQGCNIPELAGAEAALLSALTNEPSNPEANFYMARVRNRRQEHTSAIEAMKTALEHAGKRSSYRYEMGLIYRDARKLPEAIEEWKTTVELEPDHADALESLGQAYLEMSDNAKAIEYFERALKADPARIRILASIGDGYYNEAKWKEAIASYERALKKDPRMAPVYYKIGRAYTEQNQQAKAITWYQKATKVDDQNPMPFWYLGYAYKQKDKKPDAIAAFRAYLKRKPEAEDKKEIEDEIYDLER